MAPQTVVPICTVITKMLSAKQRRHLASIPKGKRAQQRAAYVAQNSGRGANSLMNRDASMLRGIKQGVGKSVPRPFGSVVGNFSHHECFDAFHTCHLTLPRAIGPYAVVRTTQVLQSNLPLTVFGTHFDEVQGKWTNVCALGVNDDTATLGAADNTHRFVFEQLRSGSWKGAQVAPAAFSIQVMNPNALQTTNGIVYAGRIRTTLKESESLGAIGKSIAMNLVSYNNPRLASAAKLAFRGLHLNEVPFNMSELANFTSVNALTEEAKLKLEVSSPMPKGFAPAFVYNPGKIDLQYLVCCEWRVRFDPSNPAQATHQYHPPATESTWHQMQKAMEAMGHGAQDIAEVVANVGHTAYNIGSGLVNTVQSARAVRAIAGAGQLALMG